MVGTAVGCFYFDSPSDVTPQTHSVAKVTPAPLHGVCCTDLAFKNKA